MSYYKATRCACGCGQEVRPKTPNRPARYVHGHNPVTRPSVSLSDRFWPRVDTSGACWIWTGGRDNDGRGRVWFEGRNITAPRASLIIHGLDVPDGFLVCHHCDNPSCVRPDHLYIGTALENVRDMDERGRRVSRVPHPASSGERNHNAKLSDSDVADIRSRYSGAKGEQTALAREYGVTPQLIHLIVKENHRA